MRLVHLYKKTEILKYQIAGYNDPLGYMRAAMAAILSGHRVVSIATRLLIFFDFLVYLKDFARQC